MCASANARGERAAHAHVRVRDINPINPDLPPMRSFDALGRSVQCKLCATERRCSREKYAERAEPILDKPNVCPYYRKL